MPVSLSGRHFLKLLDFTPEEIRHLIRLSHEFKRLKAAGVPHRHLEGKNIVLLFEKTSTRTRCSFEAAGHDLGMGVTYLDPGSSQMGKKESIPDTARVLGRMYDGIEYRGYGQEVVEKLAEHAGVPVWNGLTTEFHPTQMIADMMTIEERFPDGLKGKKLVYMGDAHNNVANSLMVACTKLGMHFVACGPQQLMPEADLVTTCRELAEQSGGSVTLTSSVAEAVIDAHVIYTDVWVSMGEPDEVWAERIEALAPYQVNSEMFSTADPNAIFMHCLPAYHDLGTDVGRAVAEKFGMTELECTDEVFESARSVVFDEAENRMHSIKAIMYATLK
ncbi:ornithine carbamoyltransferase [Corynebacterium epidermidicanis]|uniref:Ornithine carbamoyltransferase n=1 Tax=Corynebacterium epidermidicanis TaxID=1050174 RepID=A0A0G3GTI4_9CORY|nr:ornithine carbamoyltransferase [Corynebacterium epidermidicanis]AKK02117.1 ornithine carbamoyltransferase [Corynebacterium epidermidicanis]